MTSSIAAAEELRGPLLKSDRGRQTGVPYHQTGASDSVYVELTVMHSGAHVYPCYMA